MHHELYRLLTFLDKERLFYRLDRYQPDAVTATVTLVGERVEISVFDDGHIEYSRFLGDESVESGSEAIARLYERLRTENSNDRTAGQDRA
jgi:hypothetical protein